MRLNQLVLENFRGFAKFTVQFENDVTVLVGENASGKSSILDAVAIALASYVSAFPEIGGTAGRTLSPDDVRLIRAGRQEASYATPTQVELWATARVAAGGDGLATWGGVRRVALNGKSTRLSEPAPSSSPALMTLHELGRGTVFALAHGSMALPLLAHHTAGRLWNLRRNVRSPRVSTVRARAELRSRGSGYLDALGPESNPALVAGWMKSLETQRLQAQARIDDGRADDHAIVAEALTAFRALDRALQKAVPQYPGVWFDIDEARDEVWVKREDGATLPLRALSDGYRTLVGLVVDIAARAHRLNPQFGERAAAEIEGVVLIDEIDLHLHPKLQQTILSRLRDAFPKLQFIVTTHAPQVIGSCEARWLRMLEQGATEPKHVDHAKGLDVNTVLRDIMGAPYRDPKATALIADLKDALDDEDVPRARPLLEELIDLVGPTDGQVVRQSWELADIENRQGEGAVGHAKD